jgi:hypothetical protein
MVTAPEHYIVPDLGKGLKGIVFQDKAILSDVVAANGRLAAYIADQFVLHILEIGIYLLTQLVHLFWRHRSKECEISRGKMSGYLFECDYRQAFEFFFGRYIPFVNAKSHYFVGGIVLKIVVS